MKRCNINLNGNTVTIRGRGLVIVRSTNDSNDLWRASLYRMDGEGVLHFINHYGSYANAKRAATALQEKPR